MSETGLFSGLPRERLETMAAGGRDVVESIRVLAKTGHNVVGETLSGHGTFYEWDHYPPGDIYDPESHAQFYYHAHRPGEHGHFHTYLRPKGMPPGCTPAPLPDYEPLEDEDDELSHLVAISMNEYGLPARLFTTNRWLTDEVWYPAADVCRMLDNFEIDLAQPSWPVNRWIGGMLTLFHPQIVALVHERDAIMAERTAQDPETNHYEDRDYEVVSLVEISIDDQIRAIETALEAADED